MQRYETSDWYSSMNKNLLAGVGVLALAAAAAYYYASPTADAAHAQTRVEGPAAGRPPGASAPVSVTAMAAQSRDFDVRLEATGTVTSANMVDVRPQVSSVITKVLVREGQFVKAGELLFTLDTRTDAANVAKAQAQLARDQATLADAQRQLARSRELFAQKFLAQAAVDTTLSQVEAQTAVVQADRVAIDAAQVGLGYGRITAPSSGRVGAIAVYAGSSVVANTTTLVTITQLDPIYVSFALPQRNLSDALQNLRTGAGKVVATMPESRNALTGKLQFVDNAVDAGSGTVKVKAVFDNKSQSLWPGAFVNVTMTVRTLKDAVVVPLSALVQGTRGSVVFLVDEGNKVVSRPVTLVDARAGEAVVDGVRAGERVIVDGRQNVRPGSVVVVRAADPAGPTGASAQPRSGASAAGASAPTAATATDAGAKATNVPIVAPQP